MAKEENLVSLAERTTEEQRLIASMGGKASGEARRKKKAMREILTAILGLRSELTADEISEYRAAGLDADEIDNQTKMLMKMFRQAMEGDIKAAEFVRDTAGEKPRDSMSMSHEISATTELVLWEPDDSD
jgi:hypothetical protein